MLRWESHCAETGTRVAQPSPTSGTLWASASLLGASLPGLVPGEDLSRKPHQREARLQKVHEGENAIVNTEEVWHWEGFFNLLRTHVC